MNRSLKVFDSRVAIFAGHGAKNKAGKEIAAAQILFVRAGVLRCRLCHSHLFRGTQLETQTLNDALRDSVLNGDDIGSRGVDAITPENVSRGHIQQLGRDSETLACVNETSG